MRSALILAAALVAACKGEPFRPDAGPKPIDGAMSEWFQPRPGEAKNWDIQLSGYAFATPRAMMIVNLWDVVPSAQTIAYPGGPVMVPAGAKPTAIADLHGQQTKVLCHVGMGVVNLADPDAMQLAGYEATPPDDPTLPAAGSVIGWHASSAAERFVNYRDAAAQAVLLKRVELAKAIGCDGIVAFRTDLSAFGTTTGFTQIDPTEDLAWIKKIVADAHTRKLAVGARGVAMPNIDQLKLELDFGLVERCGESDDCDAYRPFTAAGRAVFGLDYTTTEEGTANTRALQCARFADDMVDGIIKMATDGTAPDACQ